MYIERLHIKNFRCFAETEFDLNYPGRKPSDGSVHPRLENVNLFLGDNGSGKTSVFRACVLTALGSPAMFSGLVLEENVRRWPGNRQHQGLQEASIRAELQVDDSGDPDVLTDFGHPYSFITIVREADLERLNKGSRNYNYHDADSFYRDVSPSFFVCGYGANRRTERPEGYGERTRSVRYQRVAGLFEDHVGLVPITYAVLELEKKKFLEEARTLLNELLPELVKLTDETDRRDRPLFNIKGTLLPFNALSDGYRTFIGWVWDLLLQLARVAPEGTALTEIPGVVIVDEIDLFLHPEWQRRVVEQVARTFPKLQFFFSSHSPLVAGSLEAANLYVLEDDPDNDGAMVVRQYRERVHGLSADQILTSSYFDLETTRAQPFEAELNELSVRAVGGDDPNAALEYLRRLRIGDDATATNGIEETKAAEALPHP